MRMESGDKALTLWPMEKRFWCQMEWHQGMRGHYGKAENWE